MTYRHSLRYFRFDLGVAIQIGERVLDSDSVALQHDGLSGVVLQHEAVEGAQKCNDVERHYYPGDVAAALELYDVLNRSGAWDHS